MWFVKRWGSLRLLSSQNKQVHKNRNSPIKSYLCTLIFASFIGTYLDLWMVGKGSYSFPIRPFPTLFSINILFTLCLLPLLTFFLIYVFNRINGFQKILLGICSSLTMAIIENGSEQLGVFVHSNEWKHVYSIVGYLIFILLIWNFYKWLNNS
jgi:hypothetical protein